MVAHAGPGRRRPPAASAAEAICEQVWERCGIDVAQLRCDAVLERTESPTQEADRLIDVTSADAVWARALADPAKANPSGMR